MHTITFKIEGGEDVTVFAADGDSILLAARKAGVAIDAPCSGNGTCGKCRVRLLDGIVGHERSKHIADSELAEGWRLACVSSVSGDVVIRVPAIADLSIPAADLSVSAKTADYERLMRCLVEAGIGAGCGISIIDVLPEPPSLESTMPDNERFCRALGGVLGADRVVLPFDVLKTLPELLRDNDFSVRCVAENSGGVTKVLDVLSGRGDGEDLARAYGLAIDVGTTTVSGLLVDLVTGVILSAATTVNDQIRYGADVINRIIEQQKSGGVDRMQHSIVKETLLPLIDDMCAHAGVSKRCIYRMVIASNTTMNHLLLGINANFLRMEPYIPAFFEIDPFNPASIGIELAPTARVSITPNIGSYVGGDITAGVLASMIWNDGEMSALIDLGTNGEIVFGNDEFLMSCACSAGPAFEGGDISCGMRAAAGAIEACVIEADTMEPELTVIGGGKPRGLCGSGLIDVTAELFRCGIINGKGKFIREGSRVRCDEYGIGSYVLAFSDMSADGREISISEVDLDNFIRAKGAIFSALVSLAQPLGFAPDDIGQVIIAGGIGSGINIRNAISIGMLPSLPEDRYSYIGNSSLSGAYAALVSTDADKKLRELARSMTYVELSTQPGYMDSFIAACFLPHTDDTLFSSTK